MTGVLTWGTSALGAAVVVVVLLDIFATLWQPTGQGRITHAVMAGVWRASTPRRRAGANPGPVAMLLVVAVWTAGIVVGWALVYAPHLPGSFSYAVALDPAARSSLLDALYVSTVTVGTLGFGDVVPTATWLRLVVPLQGLTGFVLFTAAVSWTLQTYPALARRRLLALRLSLLRRARDREGASGMGSPAWAYLLGDLATALAGVRVDLAQHPETYFHRESGDQPALPVMLCFAEELADAACCSDRADVQLGGAVLSESLTDFCTVLRQQFGHQGDDDRAVLAQFAAEHGHAAG